MVSVRHFIGTGGGGHPFVWSPPPSPDIPCMSFRIGHCYGKRETKMLGSVRDITIAVAEFPQVISKSSRWLASNNVRHNWILFKKRNFQDCIIDESTEFFWGMCYVGSCGERSDCVENRKRKCKKLKAIANSSWKSSIWEPKECRLTVKCILWEYIKVIWMGIRW